MKNNTSSFALFLTFLLLIGLNSCSPDKKQNVILITLDTQRADFISAYNNQSTLTPNIDSLAENGVLFEHCYSPIPITLPAHASILYSQLPSQLQVYNNGDVFNGEGKVSLAEIFQKKDFTTAAFVSLGVLKEKFGLNRGFDTYDDSFPRDKWYLTAAEVSLKATKWLEANKLNDFFLWIHYSDPHGPYSPPGEPPDFKVYLNEIFLKELCLDKYRKEELDLKLKKGKNALRFEVANVFGIDENTDLARLDIFEVIPSSEDDNPQIEFGEGATKRDHRDEVNIYLREKALLNILSDKKGSVKIKFRGRLMLRPKGYQVMYGKEVAYMDKEIGKLLARIKDLNLFDNTAIVVVGDHGEGLGEYRLPGGAPHIGHIHYLNSLYLEVPYMIHSPLLKTKGKRIATPVSIIDVGPTILGLSGWKKNALMEGKNALKLNEQGRNPSGIFGETYQPQSFYTSFSLIRHPWHLIITPQKNKFELYDLSKDPLESQNLYPDAKDRKEIVEMKIKLNNYMRTSLAQKLPEEEKDKDTLEMLKSLGYIK